MWEAKKNSYLSSYDFFVHLKGKMKEKLKETPTLEMS